MLIDQLRRAAGGAAADKDLCAGILEDLCSKAKDLSSAAARGHCRRPLPAFKARVINSKEAVYLWGERGKRDNKKAAGVAATEE